MASQPVVSRPVHRSGALLDHLARRMRLRAESVLAPLQQALSTTLEMDGTNIVGLLNELEAEDLIERRRSPEDRRRHVVALTEAGAKRLAEAECALAAVDNEVLGALDDSQRELLYNLLLQAARGSDVSCPLD